MLLNKSILVAGLLALTSQVATAAESEIYSEDFEAIDTWTFTTVNLSSNENWEASSFGERTFARISGFQADANSNDWLVSSSIDLTALEFEYAYFQFDSAKRYDGDQLKVLVSTDYSDNVETATWVDLTDTAIWSTGNFAWADSGKLDVSEYIGESITIAFQYTSTPSFAAIWEVDEFKVFTTDENPSTEFFYLEEFEGSTLGQWTDVSLASNRDWARSSFDGNGFARISGYQGDEFSNDWLVSPTFDMSTGSYPYFQFDSSKNFDGDVINVFYSTDYTDDVETATWIEVTDSVSLSQGGYEWVESGRVDLWKLIVDENGDRDTTALENVTIAFQYTSSEAGASTWQLDNIEIGSQPLGVINQTEQSSPSISSYDDGLNDWIPVSLSGSKQWAESSFGGANFVSMSGFRDDADSNDLFVSPVFDMSNFQEQTISFYNATNFTGPQLKLFVTTDIEQGVETPYVDVVKANWVDISDRVIWSEGGYDWVFSGTIDVSDIVSGEAVFAFQYTSDDTGSATWQLDHVNIGGVVETRAEESNFTTYTIEEFDGTFGNWSAVNLASDKDWELSSYIEKTFAEISGFRGDVFSDDWLVSPTIDTTLVDWDEAFVEFISARNYGGDDLKLLISTDYSGDVSTATWTDISDRADWSAGSWEWAESGEVDITDFIGGNITVAFQYTSSDAGSATWRIDYVRIVEKDDGFSDVPFEVKDTSGGALGLYGLLLLIVAGARRRFA
ncbi:choice-of-anchor J domain-containing protein [Pleionea sediminis]|uniref:choice-of-anchor J domain-containing protein n=1 Tax=Pleionea sediminis TaxID=2569479 RepID=UPI0011865F99|nr:choice-of-anchor J domain-containing protein [Pleionea sediminis]